MKIVHSYWSKPTKVNDTRVNEKFLGGWRNQKYQYMSWALSCLSFIKYYGNIELVTDSAGKELLVDKLKLPYTSVKVELDILNKYPVQLWAIGKLYAYGLQDEPFIHVDNDIYIWKKFSDEINNAQLIAQNIDDDESDYNYAMVHLKKLGIDLPLVLKKDYKKYHKFNSSNVGIIGGNNLEFFKEYVKNAFEFINFNIGKVNKTIRGSSYAIIYEQYLFSALARKNGIKVHHLFEGQKKEYMNLINFMNKYMEMKYVHLFSDAKFFFEYCRELEHQLVLEYPEYHGKIISLINKQK